MKIWKQALAMYQRFRPDWPWTLALLVSAMSRLQNGMKGATQSLAVLLRFAQNLVLTIAMMVLVWTIVTTSSSVTVGPVAAPIELSSRGYTPEVLAARVAAEMTRIQRDADRLVLRLAPFMPHEGIVATQDQPDIVLPGQGLSFRTLVQSAKHFFGRSDSNLAVDIAQDQGMYVAQIRVVGGRYDRSVETARTAADDGQRIVASIAEAAMAAVQPVALANYKIWVEGRRCDWRTSCNFGEALTLIDRMLASLPVDDDKWALLSRGLVQINLDQFEESAKTYQKVTELDPRFSVGYNNWGGALRALGKYDEAVEKLEKAVRLNPVTSSAHYNWGAALGGLGIAMGGLGRYAEAIPKYQKAISVDPQDPASYFGWGTALSALGRHDEAIKKHERAVEVDPEFTPAYVGWGSALTGLGRNDEAITMHAKAIARDGFFGPAYAGWGMALSGLGRHEEAIEKYKKALELDSKLGAAAAYTGWATALDGLGQHQDAQDMRRKASELQRGH